MAHLGPCLSDLFSGAALAFYVTTFTVLSASARLCARPLACYCMSRQRRVRPVPRGARVFRARAPHPVALGWLKEESVFLMVYRVLDVVREFFLGEGVPDWAARGVADQGQRANVAHLEAAAVALHARR